MPTYEITQKGLKASELGLEAVNEFKNLLDKVLEVAEDNKISPEEIHNKFPEIGLPMAESILNYLASKDLLQRV